MVLDNLGRPLMFPLGCFQSQFLEKQRGHFLAISLYQQPHQLHSVMAGVCSELVALGIRNILPKML